MDLLINNVGSNSSVISLSYPEFPVLHSIIIPTNFLKMNLLFKDGLC
ncbi:MAG: hypothetical protein PWR20_1368 [Bacteroidales bacterium]|jgi:hypothetical protein|nr:hypothetical protein [Bacteroidales bacterium]MDN5329326.1 hypothetical protein [Bacteroidales bacterium]